VPCFALPWFRRLLVLAAMEAGYCNRKKTDDICEGICDAEVRPRFRSVPFSPARSAGATLCRALPERFLFLAVLSHFGWAKAACYKL
jgi:hypothetical protein